ncbi:oligosaccharide flippase family protein [Flavobacterium sp. RHBU_3]|uniref:oligosaccharide flippase family protein n=1 Tax=Flavobacterium sp. RHBU_3 TaxID=3391184 RepID=UPI0039848E72
MIKSTIITLPNARSISKEQVFMFSAVIVNAGNYLYNLILGRLLGPEAFADAAVLITMLLILSFIGMTFQIVSAKYTVLLDADHLESFLAVFSKIALFSGAALGIVIALMSQVLQSVLHTHSEFMFLIFGAGLPLYFIASLNRGVYQGRGELKKLAFTYQSEMISRLVFTLSVLLSFTSLNSSIVVSMGILISLITALFPFQKRILISGSAFRNSGLNIKPVLIFFLLTAFYELTQIVINNSDILLVKHYFPQKEAGLYASLALIGRIVYFVAWMFVMMLLPAVIKLSKEGKNTRPVLMKYVAYIAVLSAGIVIGALLFPKLAVNILFGSQFLAIAPLLWLYALATSIFAIANIFSYYFLSLGQYIPVVISAVLGLSQIVLIILFHSSLKEVVIVQVVDMAILLIFQLAYFFYHTKKNSRRN